MNNQLKPINFISPSSLYYWERCPIRAVYSCNFRAVKTFPTHPDSALGTVIHSFYENKNKWGIYDKDFFEVKWLNEIGRINQQFISDPLQKVYYPLEWNSKYYAVKKMQLRENLLKGQVSPYAVRSNIVFEKWLDDGLDIGGKIDFVRYNDNDEISEIIDFKTGNIFEVAKKDRNIKMSYIYQISLYAYLVKSKQNLMPTGYVQNNKGEKFEIKFDLTDIQSIHQKAVDLKTMINTSISRNKIEELANPSSDNCSYCNYRPLCEFYKKKMINDFSNKMVDVYGRIERVMDSGSLILSIPEKVLTLKNIISVDELKEGDMIYVYNLFCPDHNNHILFATKSTLIAND